MRIFLQKKFTPISVNLKSLNTIFLYLKSKNGIYRRARTRPESGSEPARRSIISLPIEGGVFFLCI